MRFPFSALAMMTGALALGACSSSNTMGGFVGTGGASAGGTGGSTATGGATGTGSGGSSTSSGGSTGSGGEIGTGGMVSSGGSSGTGGAASTGTGGDASGGGGMTGMGGMSTSSGGAGVGSGGAPQGGSSGATGGAAGGGGSGLAMSAGCGKMPPMVDAPAANHNYGKFMLTVAGQPTASASRLYYVRLPANYDPARAYKVVYIGPGCSYAQDSAPTMRKGFPFENDTSATGPAANAILVQMEQGFYNAAQYNSASCVPGTPPSPNNACQYCFDDWAYKTSIPDMTPATPTMPVAVERAYFDALHKVVEANYCVDKQRQFYAGYSSGAWLAQQLGCWFPDVLRAQANVTGGLPPPILTNVNGPNDYCVKKPIAAMAIHDFLDQSNVYQGSVDGLKRIFALNGCTGTFTPPSNPNSNTAPPGASAYSITGVPNSNQFRCWKYNSCPATSPVVFCVSNGKMHQSQSDSAVPGFWEFFSQF